MRRYRIKAVLPFLFLTLTASAVFAESRRFTCRAIDPRSRKVVFTCSGVEVFRASRPVNAEIVYRNAKGRIFAREKLTYRRDRISPDVTLNDNRDGRRETVERNPPHFIVTTQESAKAPIVISTVNLPDAEYAGLTIPAIPRYLSETFADKPADTRHIFYCLFPQEKKLLRLRATLEAFVKYRGREALRLRVQPDNFVYRWFSDPVRLTISKKSGRMLRYEGLHYIRDPQTGHGSIVDLSFAW